ncbi:uncharacterized protein I206_100703 [Kwoniella pini CBS 10737]|uniref:Uncharacterized protein n=1 Tax=Kwoniella pini CBS 10737 TaxID=1296096 RepID=A0A1B9ICI8_9TREE|nr:uncharacterized protein I206_00624 [Kwoniella pini CBS 10737]OCF53322.1 hypothetical protein I206_00624 [Kwoniella pini CBS 10737]
MIPTTPVFISPEVSTYSLDPSPRPSIASSNCSGASLLTPIDELDKMSSDLTINTEEVEEVNAELVINAKETNDSFMRRNSKANLPNLTVPPPAFSNFSFGTFSPSASSSSSIGLTPSPLSSTDDVALPSEGFKFGTCPTDSFVGTPTAEQGPFEYPVASGSSSGFSASPPRSSPTLARRGSLALGMTHRRGSIIASHPHPNITSSHGLSPPPTRRSSTCSTITTLPIAGRRPSIIHSATVEVNLPQTHPSVPPFEEPPPSSASSSRRPSVLMFPSKPLPAPIPPSLLARRGSLPAAQLFGIPLSDQPNRTRASYSSGSNPVSTASLYLRRQSMASESGFSNGSGATVMENSGLGDDHGSRRLSMRSGISSTENDKILPLSSQRRGSLSFFPPIPAQSPIRSSSISSTSTRSSIASSSSSIRSSTSSRVPINFSPRHPNYAHTYGPSRQSSITTTSTNSLPCSPKVSKINRRNRKSITEISHSSSSSCEGNSNLGLSSSEEENENENENEEELPTPNNIINKKIEFNQNQNQIPSIVPTFSNPWNNTNLIENKLNDISIIENNKYNIPLETPPLETVLERPPLETFDSGATEKP